MKRKYEYRGPVMEFDICIERDWRATTWAQSAKKARSNLEYRYKKDHNRVAHAKITLPGKVVERSEDYGKLQV